MKMDRREVWIGVWIWVDKNGNGLLTLGRLHEELVNGEALATGGGDPGAGSLGEAESGHLDSGQLNESLVISDGADDNDGSVLLLAEMLEDLGQGERRAVRPRGNKSSQHGLAESGVGSPGHELEKFDEEVVIQILALCVFLVLVLHSSSFS